MLPELQLSGPAIGYISCAIAFVTAAIVVYFRKKYNKFTSNDHQTMLVTGSTDLISSRTKYQEIDVFKNTYNFFNYGLCISTLLSLAAISWTTFEKGTNYSIIDFPIDDVIEMEIPRIPEPPQPLPPPPPPAIQEIPNNEILENPASFKDDSILPDTDITPYDEPIRSVVLPPTTPPTIESGEEEIFKIVEQMPRFPGCEEMKSEDEKARCSQSKLLSYLYKNISYPTLAKEAGVQGQVVVQFVVDKEGSITNIKLLRDIGAGCGDVAMSVIKSMNLMGKRWTPGKQRGKPVKVIFTLPIKFKLD